MRRPFDLSLYLVTDAGQCGARGVEAVVGAAVAGGVTLVQLRDKRLADPEFAGLALALKAVVAPHRVPLVVNDRAAIAVAVKADGLHIGQGDGDPAAARALIGPERILGLSIEAAGQLASAHPDVVDYLGVGPLRATATKPDAAPALGFDGLAAILRAAPVPAVAIGGVGAADVGRIVRTGAAGVALVSAICAAADPEAAARAFRRRLDEARRGAVEEVE